MTRLIFILIAIIGISQAQTIQYIGAPTTTVISRGNFRTDSIFYLPKRTKAPTDTAAIRYQISDSSLYVWTGSQWVKAGGSGTISGSGLTGYIPQFSASTTLDTSALYTLGSRLGIGTSTFAYNSTNTANIELNSIAGGILGFKRNDSARGYLYHTGDNMELANTVAGAISFNTNSATRGSISSAGVWRLHNLAGTGDRVVVASSNGTLSASSSVTGLVDTTTISTRAWRQKGDDSLGAIIATKVNISDTSSMLTNYIRHAGYGLTKSGQSFLVDTAAMATRARVQKGIDSVVSIIPAAGVGGSGTTNYLPKFTASTTLGNSQIFDNGTNVGIGTGTPLAKLHIGNGSQSATNGASTKAQVMDGNSGGRAAFLTLATSSGSTVVEGQYESDASGADLRIIMGSSTNHPVVMRTNNTERLRIFANGRVFVGASPTDAGYQFDINGTLRSVNGANFATTSGNVGIGTASPSTLLHVKGIANTGTVLRLEPSTSTTIYSQVVGNNGDLILQADPNNQETFSSLKFEVDGTERMRVNVSGNVGIGTTSPISKLEVLDGDISVSTFGTFSFFNTNRNTIPSGAGTSLGGIRYRAYSTGTTYQVGAQILSFSSAAWSSTSSPSYLSFQTTPSGSVTPSERMVIDASGNVGIGTASPSYKLSVKAATDYNIGIGILGSYASINVLNDAASAYNQLRIDASPVIMNSYSGSEMLLNTTSDAGDYKLQVAGNIYNTGSAVLAATGGTVGIGATANLAPLTVYNPTLNSTVLEVRGGGGSSQSRLVLSYGNATTTTQNALLFSNTSAVGLEASLNRYIYFSTGTSSVTERMRLTSDGELILDASGTDAGDYKLQVVGNARIGTGKLDIASNTTFGLGVARSGTSEVAGQIYNSNGILYLGAESSAGGQIFSGSSAYAAVIGSGANYPLQFATNNATRATINTNGELLINTTSDQGDYKLQVNGSVYNTGQVTRGVINVQGTGGQVFVDSTSNLSSFAAFQTLSGSNASALFSGNVTWNTTGNPNAIDVYVTNTASGANANFINVGDGTNNFKVTKDAGIITGNPTSGTATKWKLGSVVATSVQLDTANYVEVEINGTFYRLAIVTPL